jgi:hypothetical protein
MKNRSETYGKTRETLPLEGGGKWVGVKGLTSIARRLRKHSTPHLTLSPKGRGGITFNNTLKS